MIAVNFPLRPPRLAFVICGWRWQNDEHEIKYSVLKFSTYFQIEEFLNLNLTFAVVTLKN